MVKRVFLTFVIFFICLVSSYAQRTVFDLKYYQHSDGCLTVLGGRGHHDSITDVHRNDTAFVNSEINRFNNLVRQYNAISIQQQRAGARADYIYFIDTEQSWVVGEGTVILHHYNILLLVQDQVVVLLVLLALQLHIVAHTIILHTQIIF